MNICKKCQSMFPSSITIDGVQHIINKRKFCLNCSPFKKHNTRDLTKPINLKSKFCLKCRTEHPIKMFYKRKNRNGYYPYCKTCTANISSNNQQEMKRKCVEYKGVKCNKCGYKKSMSALTFHHKDPTKKEFSIARTTSYNFDVVKKELDKCILLCANCHAEEHDYLRGKWSE